jgi:hypothetical protein
MKKKGFKSIPTTQQIKEYLKLSLRHRLEWLEEANRFTYKALKGKRKKAWEAFRKGEI